MVIEMGKFYSNRTLKYLIPALQYYGETFKVKFNLIFKLGVGIFDKQLEGSYLEGKPNLYILVDKAVRPDMFLNFITWIKHQEYYVTDYAYDDLEEGRRHMIVIAFPYALSDSYFKFLEGKYSQMYSKEEIRNYFVNKSDTINIFNKSVLARPAFIKTVKEVFKADISEEDFLHEPFELDIPPQKEEETF